MTTCQNCGEEGECNEPCANCFAVIDPCGEPQCGTCVEQYTVYDQNAPDETDEEIIECLVCEGPCTGSCELARIESELNENAKKEKERGKGT